MTYLSTVISDKSSYKPAIFRSSITEGQYDASSDFAYTVNLLNGTIHKLTLTANATITFPAVAAGSQFSLMLLQDATGSRTVTWPSSSTILKWPSSTAPTLTGTANKMDIFSFISDGVYWYGILSGQNY